jgi:predicted RNase H-like HicB family nuclease
MAHEVTFPVVFQPVDEDGYIVVECPAFEGCVTQGRSKEEALANIREAIAACLAAGDVPSETASVTVAA